MGAYNLTSMMRQERSIKFKGVEVKGLFSLLVFILFLLITTTLIFVVASSVKKDAGLPVAIIYALISISVFMFLQSVDLNEHIYTIIDAVLPKQCDIIYHQDDMHVVRKIIEKKRGVVVVYKTSRKRK